MRTDSSSTSDFSVDAKECFLWGWNISFSWEISVKCNWASNATNLSFSHNRSDIFVDLSHSKWERIP